MAQDRRYQLVLLGPAVDQFASELKSEFDARIRDIGLDPAKDVQILRSPNMKATAIDWDAAPVAIWFGNEQSPSQKDLDLLEDFQVRRPNPVFPVCETLTNYEKKVPASLRPINGEEWNAPTIVGNVLKAFNLHARSTPSLHQLSASPIRERSPSNSTTPCSTESFACSWILRPLTPACFFRTCCTAGFRTSTWLSFWTQKMRLTRIGCTRNWSRRKSRASAFWQILWPQRPRDPATQFCDLVGLERTDFVKWSPELTSDQPDPADMLKPDVVAKIVREVERTRIRSIRNRRDQVVTEIVDQAQHRSLQANVSPTGDKSIPVSFVEFDQGAQRVALAFPIVGCPDSILLQSRHELLQLRQLDLATACVVFDEYRMTPDLKRHLEWLNDFLQIRTVPITSIDSWLRRIVP